MFFWRAHSNLIQQKTQIGVSIKMPAHSIVNVGFRVTISQQANQCTRCFVSKIRHPRPRRSRKSVSVARPAAGALPKSKKHGQSKQANRKRLSPLINDLFYIFVGEGATFMTPTASYDSASSKRNSRHNGRREYHPLQEVSQFRRRNR